MDRIKGVQTMRYAVVGAAALCVQPALSQVPSQEGAHASSAAVAYQIDAAHTGSATFTSLTLPTAPLWHVTLDGQPSYALIVQNKVIVTVNVANNTELVALDRNSGAVVWGPILLAGAANATYDSGRVFVSGTAGLMQAFDANSGRPLWTAELVGQYYFSAGPTALNGIVYGTGAGEGGTVYAFAESSGALLWTVEVNNGDSSTPAVTNTGLYVAYPCWTYDLTPATGHSVWTSDTGCDGGGGGTTVVADGKLFAPNGFGTYNGDVFDAATGRLEFSYVADNPPAFNKTIGFFLQSGTLRGTELKNYSVIWSFAGDATLTTSPIVVNNVVFIGSSSGNLYGLNAQTGKVIWQVNVGASIPGGAGWGAQLPLSGLSAGQGLLVVPAGSTLMAYELAGS